MEQEESLIDPPDFSKMSMRECLDFLKTHDIEGGCFHPLIERLVLETEKLHYRIDTLHMRVSNGKD